MFSSCKDQEIGKNVIDISKAKEVDYHPIMDNVRKIEFIPLETNKDNLLGFSNRICMTDSFIYILDRSAGRIHSFDLKGNALKTLKKNGKGPNEYFEIKSIRVGSDGCLYVLALGKILRYDRNLKLLSVTSTVDKGYFADFFPFNNNNMVVFNNYSSNSEKNPLLLHLEQGKITNEYGESLAKDVIINQFFQYDSLVNFVPLFYNNEIISINENFDVTKRYSIVLDEVEPAKGKKDLLMGSAGKKDLQSYCIRSFIETKHNILIKYRDSPVFCACYNKESQKCVKGEYAWTKKKGGLLLIIDNCNQKGDSFIGIIPCDLMLQFYSEGMIPDDKISAAEINKLKRIQIGDNPIVVKVEMEN